MKAISASTPFPTDYIKSDPRMFFSYNPANSKFQNGYLGVGISTISGMLHIRLSNAVRAKNITLNFIGSENVEWYKFKIIRANEIFASKLINIWESGTELGHELITDLDLPFEFEIPGNAVESFVTQFGKVQYTLIATINRMSNSKKISIEVMIPLYRRKIALEQEMSPLFIKSHAKVRKVPISWEANLPSTFFDLNSEAVIKLKLTSPDPDLQVHKISTCLKTYVQYFVEGYTAERHKIHAKYFVYGKDITMTLIDNYRSFEATTILKLSSNVPPTCETKYMAVKNQVQIKVTFKRLRHNVLITKDIIVGRKFIDL
jgi:hypothetical protein